MKNLFWLLSMFFMIIALIQYIALDDIEAAIYSMLWAILTFLFYMKELNYD